MNTIGKQAFVRGTPILLLAAGIWGDAAMASSPIGTPLTAEIPVAAPAGGYSPFSAVASDAAGNFVVLWAAPSTTGGPGPWSFRRFAADGSPLSDIQTLPDSTAGGDLRHGLAMDPNGDFVVAWNCGYGTRTPAVCSQVFTPEGVTSGPGINVFEGETVGSTISYSSIDPVSVGMSATGDYVVAWSGSVDYNDPEQHVWSYHSKSFVYARHLNLSGSVSDDPKPVQLRHRFGWSVLYTDAEVGVASNGTYVVKWMSGDQAYARFYSAKDRATSKSIALPEISGVTHPTFALASNGDLLFAYEVETDTTDSPATATLYASRCTAQCSAATAPTVVGTRMEGYIGQFDDGGLILSPTSDGGTFVTWGDPGTKTVYSRAFSAQNAPLSDAFTVGTWTAPLTVGTNLSSAVTGSDNLVVVWDNVTARVFQGP
jgi:hypothetical protein